MSNKKKSLLIFVIFIIIIQIVLPIITKTYAINFFAQNDEMTMNIQLKRDESNPNIINIVATDSKYKIIDLKYVHKYIETNNIDYFEKNNSDVYTFDITSNNNIQESFELEGYGSYTVYGKNEKGDIMLSRITINDPSDMPQISVTKKEANDLNITIKVTSKSNNISKLKIAKKEDINDIIDFSVKGTDIEFEKSNNVTVEYNRNNRRRIICNLC